MKIAILGAGFAGLSSAYYLHKNNEVVVYEKNEQLGGLASGFNKSGWGWSLERTYHHIFSNDSDILNLTKEAGLGEFVFHNPETASLYLIENNYRTYPVDTPQDFLQFPLLKLSEKVRAGLIILFIKASPFFTFYERVTAEQLLKNGMGKRVWDVLWEPLFRKKFGKYADKIIASFIWTRIKKRTKTLGYPNQGFQYLIDSLARKNMQNGVEIVTNTRVGVVEKKGNIFYLNGRKFDVVVSTLPTQVMLPIAKNLLSSLEKEKYGSISYLSAVNLIIESEQPLFSKSYWINICEKNIPIMCLVQHTNLIDKKNYNNNHILYVANYVEDNNKLLSMKSEQALKYFLPYLKSINSDFAPIHTHLFKAPHAQPLFTRSFVTNRPNHHTTTKGFYIANLDMTYPHDRGTNYAVKLGRSVADLIKKEYNQA